MLRRVAAPICRRFAARVAAIVLPQGFAAVLLRALPHMFCRKFLPQFCCARWRMCFPRSLHVVGSCALCCTALLHRAGAQICRTALLQRVAAQICRTGLAKTPAAQFPAEDWCSLFPRICRTALLRMVAARHCCKALPLSGCAVIPAHRPPLIFYKEGAPPAGDHPTT